MKLVFWGVRGGIPTPGRSTVEFGGNTTCLEVLANSGEEYIFDAGSGIRELGNDLMLRYKGKVDVKLFISHDHWDHIQGLPFFVPAYVPGCKVDAYSGDKGLAKKLSIQEDKSLTRTFQKNDLEQKVKEKTRVLNKSPETNHTKRVFQGQQNVERGYFPITIENMNSELTFCDLKEYEITGKEIKVNYMYHNRHPGGMFSYKIQEGNKKIVNTGDYEQDGTFDASTKIYSLGSWDKKIAEWAKGADVFIADVQFSYEEYLKKIGWGHSYIEALCNIAVQAEVKKAYFTHHDPMHNDEILRQFEIYANKYMKENLKSNIPVFFAKEGMSLEV